VLAGLRPAVRLHRAGSELLWPDGAGGSARIFAAGTNSSNVITCTLVQDRQLPVSASSAYSTQSTKRGAGPDPA
jgi:hypothetical protein